MKSNASYSQYISCMLGIRKPHPKSKFSVNEDEKLKKLVRQYGEDDWVTISKKMGTRNQRQCKERWFNYLSPNINFRPWTNEENKKLLKLYDEYGSRWKKIARFFESRTDINVRNHFLILQRHEKKNLKKKQLQQIEKNAASHKKKEEDKNETQISSSQNLQQNMDFSFPKSFFDIDFDDNYDFSDDYYKILDQKIDIQNDYIFDF